MATARPTIQVYNADGTSTEKTVAFPSVMTAPLRPDIVRFVHTNMAKNRRQPYAVSRVAGHQTSAESWGTGRAVARIPRVAGGGTHRAGQGAFGNMCRGGRMFAPTRIWRRWHRKINLNQKRYAVATALAGSALPALVMARGHRIDEVPEIPLVLSNESVKDLTKTKAAMQILKGLGAKAEVDKVIKSRQIRRGKGKFRNRRHVMRRGPLVIYNEKTRLVNAFRNIPGVDLCCVTRLNLLLLAPGGTMGRFIIWVEDAFKQLDSLFGDYDTPSRRKKGFLLPRAVMTNSDVSRIVGADEVRNKLRPIRRPIKRYIRKKNPLKNRGTMIKLNPYEKTRLRRQFNAQAKKKSEKHIEVMKKRKEALKKKNKNIKKLRTRYNKALVANPCVYEITKQPNPPKPKKEKTGEKPAKAKKDS